MQNWQKQYLELKTQIDKTENLLDKVIEENNDLKLKLSTLKSEHEKLSIENKKLSEENIKLKERLGLNSKTSSIPSSKELYKIKKDNPKKSDKKQGAQIGHKPNLRQEMSAEISVGSISNNEARIRNKCLASYEDIELELSYSKLLAWLGIY